MAVTLPSDLIMDVMRAADPATTKTAAARLGGGAQSHIAFKGVMEGVMGPSRLSARSDDLIAGVLGAANGTTASDAETKLASLMPASGDGGTASAKPYKAFEQMVLRNMFETMMPSADSGIYGVDSSAGIWRSLSNDQLASVFSDWGGLGIAQTLADAKQDTGVKPDGQWPYFESASIRSFTG